MQAASLSYRSYALDFWGFGDTAKNPVYYSLEHQTTLLEQFTNSLGIGKIALVGHGLGAIIALLYTARHPDLVDRVLSVAYPQHETVIHPRFRSASPVELADWLLARAPSAEAVWAETPKVDPAAISISMSGLQSIDLTNLPNRLNNPVLLIHGMTDTAIQAPDLDELSSWQENTHCILFEQSAHFPMLDETSKFNRLLIDFLSLNSNTSPRQLQLKEEWKRRVR